MAAIITDKIKNFFLKDLLQDIDSSGSNYYIGIGRSQDWNATDTPPTPVPRDRDERDFRSNLQSIIAVDAADFVVPRNEWLSGTIYSAYSDNTSGYPTNPYYVVTDENAVYVCIQQGRNTSTGAAVVSTVQPTGQDTFNTGELADGYIWKFLYTIGASQDNSFVTAAFIPVTFVDSAEAVAGDLARDVEQFGVQNAALDGQILGFRITNGGTGYSSLSLPTVTVFGDNEEQYPVKATAVVSDTTTSVVNIKIAESDGSLAFGRGYTRASVVIGDPASGTTATAQPIIGPVGGLGADPRNDLKANAVMFNARPTGNEGGTFVVGNDYRQFGLIKNPTLAESDGGIPTTLFTGTSGRVLRRLTVDSTSTFGLDDIFTGQSSGAQAYLDSSNPTSLFYHQSEDTGFKPFETEEINGSPSGGTATILSDSAGDINPYSGEVLFISNQEGTDRSVEGTDDLKIVIQL